MARGQDRAEGGLPMGYLGASPPPTQPATWQRRIFVERPAELAALADELAQATVLAIDAEFSQPRRRTDGEPAHRLSLLQLAFDNDHRASYVVDAQRLADLSPLEEPLENADILKLFHGISADARVLAGRGLYPQHLLDLEAVSRSIFGQRESGLQAMLLRASGTRLDKSLQRADWARRPLTPAMIAYAARDAEMTYVLYKWLNRSFPAIVAAHELPANPMTPAVAGWILPALENSRSRSVDQLLYEAGLERDTAAQARDLAQALQAVAHPSQRARVLRLICDLELAQLAPQARPYLASPLAEERSGAARALGRLRDWQSQSALEDLREHDAVEDVRQAAATALEFLKKSPTKSVPHRERFSSTQPGGPRQWVVGDEEVPMQPDASDWRSALLQRFGASNDGEAGASGADSDEAQADDEDDSDEDE